jgi:hypothetical protein
MASILYPEDGGVIFQDTFLDQYKTAWRDKLQNQKPQNFYCLPVM